MMLQRDIDAPTHSGIIACSAYAQGKRVADIPLDQAGEWSQRSGHLVWIGLFEPDEGLLLRVQEQFNLHPLAIEDAGNAHQQPKIEQYGDVLFVVARTAQMIQGRIAFGETHLFVGKGYVVSVRHGASVSYAKVRERCEACPTLLSHGEDYILYAILDFIVDKYAPVLEAINDEVETIEDSVLSKEMDLADIERLYQLRRDLLRLRNAAVPLLDVCQRLTHTEAYAIDASMQPNFRDVTDHVRRVKEEIDTLREVLAFAFEASLMTGQMSQTGITRKLASWAAILAVPTAIAGIYGMNFKNMPELSTEYGYFIVLGAIITICVTLFFKFRKSRWI